MPVLNLSMRPFSIASLKVMTLDESGSVTTPVAVSRIPLATASCKVRGPGGVSLTSPSFTALATEIVLPDTGSVISPAGDMVPSLMA